MNPQKVALYGFAEEKNFATVLGEQVSHQREKRARVERERGMEGGGESSVALCNPETHTSAHVHRARRTFSNTLSPLSLAGRSRLIAGNAPTPGRERRAKVFAIDVSQPVTPG